MIKTRVVFFGTPEFSIPFFEALTRDERLDVVAVVSQPDRPSGRGHQIDPTPIKSSATLHTITVLQFTTLKSESAQQELSALNADLFVVVAYGKIIPKAVLDLPSRGCINVHPSLLPKYRGPSPMPWAIKEGDSTTGITIMLLDEGMDTGPLLSQVTISIDADETLETLMQKVQQQGAPLLVETIHRYLEGSVTPIVQDNTKATITTLLEREDGHINWTRSIVEIERLVRAFQPWPGTWSVWKRDGQEIRIKIFRVQESDFCADVPPGTLKVKDHRLFVDGLDGTLEIINLQPEGKSAMTASAFLLGYSDIDGVTLA